MTPYPWPIKITRCSILILVKVQYISPGGSGLVSQVAGSLSLYSKLFISAWPYLPNKESSGVKRAVIGIANTFTFGVRVIYICSINLKVQVMTLDLRCFLHNRILCCEEAAVSFLIYGHF